MKMFKFTILVGIFFTASEILFLHWWCFCGALRVILVLCTLSLFYTFSLSSKFVPLVLFRVIVVCLFVCFTLAILFVHCHAKRELATYFLSCTPLTWLLSALFCSLSRFAIFCYTVHFVTTINIRKVILVTNQQSCLMHWENIVIAYSCFMVILVSHIREEEK